MYLPKGERKDILIAYGHKDAVEKDHYEIGPDTWIYLFEDNEGKYLLVSTDYTGDYEFEMFPHLLKLNSKAEFVLQKEITVLDNAVTKKTSNTVLFEYTYTD